MLAHICDEEYHPFSRTIACLCTLLVHVMIQLKWHRDGTVAWPRDGEDMLLLEAFLLLLVSYVHMVYSMVHAPPTRPPYTPPTRPPTRPHTQLNNALRSALAPFDSIAECNA